MAGAVEILTKAKEVLMEKGWHQGSIDNDDGQLCAIGACYHAIGIKEFWPLPENGVMAQVSPAVNMLCQVLGGIHPATFNDEWTTTFNDVMTLFDDAILLAKEAETVKETA